MGIVTLDRRVESGSGRPLLPQHLAGLRASGLSDGRIRAAGLYSELDPAAVAALLRWRHPARGLGPCLCFPFSGPDGIPIGHVMVKPGRPRRKGDKTVKYESPVGLPLRAYFPPGARVALSDPAVPLVVTEGMKKALRADQGGFACVGLVGVYGWCRTRAAGPDGAGRGPRELIPDLAAVAWRGRPVAIVFDSDAAANPRRGPRRAAPGAGPGRGRGGGDGGAVGAG